MDGTERRRVLVVDDDADLSDLFAELITHHGHAVTVARDGETAIAAALEESFDVALIDLGLPRMDGYEVARRIDERLADARPVLIALTGWTQPHGADGRFDGRLTKPVDSKALLALIDRSSLLRRAPRRST